MTADALASPLTSRANARAATNVDQVERIVGLDGLRAAAILLVLISHLGLGQVVPGGFGVTLFFFISGLLITRLLLTEAQIHGRIDLGRFYLRRLLRLYPALLLTLLAGLVVYNVLPEKPEAVTSEIVAIVFYYFNYYTLLGYVHTGDAHSIGGPFGHLWSLSIEEQYYLIFPILVARFWRRPRGLWIGILVVSFLVLLWRLFLAGAGGNNTTGRIYIGTDTRLDSILYGALLAIVLSGPWAQSWLRVATRPATLSLATAVLVLCFLLRNIYFRDTIRYSLQGIALMPIVSAICFSGNQNIVTRILEYRILVRIGIWSYSLYLFHGMAIDLAAFIFERRPVVWQSAAIAMSLSAAVLSYYSVERPFVALRRRLAAPLKALPLARGSHATKPAAAPIAPL